MIIMFTIITLMIIITFQLLPKLLARESVLKPAAIDRSNWPDGQRYDAKHDDDGGGGGGDNGADVAGDNDAGDAAADAALLMLMLMLITLSCPSQLSSHSPHHSWLHS